MSTEPDSRRMERGERARHVKVSPAVIAVLKDQIMEEILEHLKKTGGIGDPMRAPVLQRQSSKSSSTSISSPPATAQKVYTPPSPSLVSKTSTAASQNMEYARSHPASPLEKPSGVRFSNRGPPRPLGGRTYSTAELSTVDQKWGRLFDPEGRPTQRLGQFLRGLANYIIDDFAPKKTIVVTPSKMAAYYQTYVLDNEPHPLSSFFRAQSNEHISQLYQDLGCQHHLIQEHSSMPPVVPALTPLGFAHWMTIHILAYPEEESRRLGKVVLEMPVDADGPLIDGKPERLPKQLSRYLLPEHKDKKLRKLLDGAIKDFLEDLGTTSQRKKSIVRPIFCHRASTSHSRKDSQSRRPHVEIDQINTSSTSIKSKPIERERQPYAGGHGSDASSSADSIKIERDRQPYAAQPDNDRNHDSLNLPRRPGRANSASRTRRSKIPEPRSNRAQSNASRDNYMPPPPVLRLAGEAVETFVYNLPKRVDLDSDPKYGLSARHCQ